MSNVNSWNNLLGTTINRQIEQQQRLTDKIWAASNLRDSVGFQTVVASRLKQQSDIQAILQKSMPLSAIAGTLKVPQIASLIPNSLVSATAIGKQIQQATEPLQRIVSQADKFSERLRQLTGPANRILREAEIRIQENAEKEKRAQPVYARATDTLGRHKWVLSPSMDISRFIQFSSDDQDVDSKMVAYYTENQYANLYSDLEVLRVNLPEELREIPELIATSFKVSKQSYKLAFTNLFSILDYLFVRHTGNEFVEKRGYTTTCKEIMAQAEMYKKEQESAQEGEPKVILILAILQSVQDIFHNTGSINRPFEDNDYGRHVLDHGRYDIRKLERINFYRLINLCVAYASV